MLDYKLHSICYHKNAYKETLLIQKFTVNNGNLYFIEKSPRKTVYRKLSHSEYTHQFMGSNEIILVILSLILWLMFLYFIWYTIPKWKIKG